MYFIKDDEFIRGKCPMTKEEIRMLSICKMDLNENSKVLDVGAGTGSISVQCSKICDNGSVIAIEKEDDAFDIINKNKEKFNCDNLKIIKGEALNVLDDLDCEFDSIFIGGSSGDIEEIIIECSKKLKQNGVMVLNFITVNNVYKTLNLFQSLNFDIHCNQVSISRTKGKSFMLIANNPIFIISAKKCS